MRSWILIGSLSLATLAVAGAVEAQPRSGTTDLAPPPAPDASVPPPPPAPSPVPSGQGLVCTGISNERICELLREVDTAAREHRAPFVGPPVAPVVVAPPARRPPAARPTGGACRNGPTSQACCQPGQLFVPPTDGGNVGTCRSVVAAVRDSLTSSRRALTELSTLRATLPAAVIDAIDCVEQAHGNPAARQACVTTLAGALAAPASTP